MLCKLKTEINNPPFNSHMQLFIYYWYPIHKTV